jgi:small subunit ribosomal protein S4
MIIGPKYKICKRLGGSVFEKCQTQKFTLAEARRKQVRGRRPKALSDFGRQLLEKQKVRYTYGITEKQLYRYVKSASQKSSESVPTLYQELETRLDNVVYRLGLVPTRRFARQVVSHGHVMVNGVRVTIPSYHVRVGDKVTVRESSRNKGMFINLAEKMAETSLPNWVAFDSKTFEGTLKSNPEFSTDTQLDLPLVLEFYSR